jgi:Transposase DDE domain/Transposase domain (DUF772)
MKSLSDYFARFQEALFPFIERSLNEPLTDKQKQFLRVLDLLQIEHYIPSPFQHPRGRKPKDRRALARAFLAKALYNLPTTELLVEMLRTQPVLRQLCGFERRQDLPSPATFSRAFAHFARLKLGDRVHEAVVKIYVEDRVVMHVSRDSTEVLARERAVKKPKPQKPAGKRGRRRADTPRSLPEPTRLETQYTQTPPEALAQLPCVCDVGAKADTKGNLHYWTGWKAHIDWADGGVPLNVVTTSASLHDSQVAIPMMRTTAQRVLSCYDLMDAAYDAEWIRAVSEDLGHVALIDTNSRRTSVLPMDEASARRYRQRSTAERGNSRLKDEFGLRHLRVRGHAKAHLHVMFGVLALFADQLVKVFAP